MGVVLGAGGVAGTEINRGLMMAMVMEAHGHFLESVCLLTSQLLALAKICNKLLASLAMLPKSIGNVSQKCLQMQRPLQVRPRGRLDKLSVRQHLFSSSALCFTPWPKNQRSMKEKPCVFLRCLRVFVSPVGVCCVPTDSLLLVNIVLFAAVSCACCGGCVAAVWRLCGVLKT